MIKEFSENVLAEDFNELLVASPSLQQKVVTEAVQTEEEKSIKDKQASVIKPTEARNDADGKKIDVVIETKALELQRTISKDSNFTEPAIETTSSVSPMNYESDLHAQKTAKNLTEITSPNGLGEFTAHSVEVTRSSNATLSSYSITTQTNRRSESHHQSTKKDETTLAKAVANNSTKKILAVRFDSKGDSIDLDGDKSDSKENEISKEGKALKKKDEKRDNLIHDHEHDDDGDQTDPENEASNDRHDESEHESDESDEIPVITIPLGDILRKYMTILPPDNSRYEYDYEDSNETLIREMNEKQQKQKISVVHLNSDSQEEL